MEKEEIEQTLKELAAESLALKTLLAHLFSGMSEGSDALHAHIKRAFDKAASDLEHVTIHLAESPESYQAVEALRIIENLRPISLRQHG